MLWNFEVSFWLFSTGKLEPNTKFGSQIFRETSVSAELASCQFGNVLWYFSGATLGKTRNTNKRFPLSQLHFSLEKALIQVFSTVVTWGLSKQSQTRSKMSSSHLRSLHMTKNMCSQVQRRGTTIRLVPTKPTKLNSQAQVQVPNRKFRVDMCFLSTPHNPRTCMLAPKTQKRHCNRKSLDKLKCLCTRSHHAWRNWNAAKPSNAL